MRKHMDPEIFSNIAGRNRNPENYRDIFKFRPFWTLPKIGLYPGKIHCLVSSGMENGGQSGYIISLECHTVSIDLLMSAVFERKESQRSLEIRIKRRRPNQIF
jgi:hypothetical protein